MVWIISVLIKVCFLSKGAKFMMAFNRHSVIDPSEAGNQPFRVNNISWMMNSEIYNHEEIKYII